MEKRISHRKTGAVLAAAAAAAGLAGFAATKADASLIVDVRATGITSSGGAISNGGKSIDGSLANGDVVTFGVFAQISGTNGANDETVTNVQGSFSSTGGLLGNLSNAVAGGFQQLGFANGTQADFDSDGDLDVGSLGSTSTGKFAARAVPAASGTTIINNNTSEIQVSTLTFTVTGGSGNALVNFIERQPGVTTPTEVWNEDGQGTVKNNINGGVFSAGTPVSVGGSAVPEPASISLLGLASVGLLARRRDKKA